MYGFVVVFLGAGIGGTLRHAVNRLGLAFGSSFPWATLAINVSGSLFMGILAGWFAFRVDGGQQLGLITTGTRGQHFRLFLTTGILGGFTTFSAFSLDAALLFERGRFASSVVYVSGSVIVSIAALLAGVGMMRP